MYRFPLLLSVLLISLALPPNSFSDETGFDYNYGPGTLQLRSQSPTQSLRLTMPSVIPGAIKPGILSVNAGTTWTNVWVDSSKVKLDYEMLDTHIAVSYGINKRLGFGMAFDQRMVVCQKIKGVVIVSFTRCNGRRNRPHVVAQMWGSGRCDAR